MRCHSWSIRWSNRNYKQNAYL